MLKVVFMGSDVIALPLLDWLAGDGSAHAEVVAVFTQPDRPAGRGQKVQPNGIKLWAEAHGLPVHQPEILGPAELGQLLAYAPDVSLVMAYGHILREEFINAPRLGTLNLHASLLPKYRGASPIQTAIASGETETGVALMRIVRALDAGAVADVQKVPIGPRDTALEVEHKLAAACVLLLARSLPRLVEGDLLFAEQEESAATFCRRLTKADGVLDFTVPAVNLAARINGLTPWPGCTLDIGGQTVKVGLADAPNPETCPITYEKDIVPGVVLGGDDAGLLVATGVGVLRLLKLQRPGGRMLGAGEFLRGFPVPVGTVLPSQPMPKLVAGTPFRRGGG
jgi:methionyl-tRNA formyltransferase